jgi:hypothetical protein
VPGDYVTTYQVCVEEAPTVCETITVTHTLVDPCDPPSAIALTAMVDQTYVLTDTLSEYTVPAPTITPDYCAYILTEVITPLADTRSAVTAVSHTPMEEPTF